MRFSSSRVKPYPSPKHSLSRPNEEFWTNEMQKMKEFAEKRIRKELKSRNENLTSHISYELVADHDIFQLQGTIIGPSDTPFEGGLFLLSIKLPYNYPFKPPKIIFQTKVYIIIFCFLDIDIIYILRKFIFQIVPWYLYLFIYFQLFCGHLALDFVGFSYKHR